MSASVVSMKWSPSRAYVLEAKYELLKLVRMPSYAIPAIVFPVMFYALFGVMFGRQDAGGVPMATYLIATYGAFGVIGAALFGFGVGIAVERGQGWMLLKRATPMPPLAFFTGKLFVCALFATAIVLLLMSLGIMAGGVRLPVPTLLMLGGTLIVGSIPFCALGLAAGYLTGPNSAPAVINLLYLPMAFASGLWIPIEILPPFVKSIAAFLPAYHLAQLALHTIGAARGAPVWSHVVALTGFTLVGLTVGMWGYRRDEDKSWG